MDVVKSFKLAFIFLLIGCATQKTSNIELPQDFHIDVVEKTLPNGLKILLVKNAKLPLFSYYTYFNVGGKFETKGITGATHFLEHMMFKGAKKYGPGEFDKLVEGNGGQNNAYTTSDLTVYYENLPSEHLETIIDVEADRMQNLLLEEKAFASEKDVVLEERKMRYENSDRGKLYLKMMGEVFKGTPYGTPVIGSIEDIKGVSRDQVMEYFKKFYAPNNAIIVIVGDINPNETFKMIQDKFGTIPASADLEDYKEKILSQKNFKFKGKYGDRNISLRGTSKVPMFSYAFKGVKIGEQDGFVLDILSTILGQGDSSYLNQKMVHGKKPWMQNVYAANYTMQDSGVFFVGGQLLPKKNIWSSKYELRKQIKRSCNEAITPRSLQKVKNMYLVDMLSGLDTNAGIARFVGDRAVYYGDPHFYKKEMSIYGAITEEELRDACRKYLDPKNAIYVNIWNKNPGK
jgi:zinc protease